MRPIRFLIAWYFGVVSISLFGIFALIAGDAIRGTRLPFHGILAVAYCLIPLVGSAIFAAGAWNAWRDARLPQSTRSKWVAVASILNLLASIVLIVQCYTQGKESTSLLLLGIGALMVPVVLSVSAFLAFPTRHGSADTG